MTNDNLIIKAAARNQQVRLRRLGYAVFASVQSKFLAIIVQWLALPLALKALGTDRYAAFLALQALVAWTSLLALGLAPSLPHAVSNAQVAGARALERDIFQTAVIYLAGVCVLFITGMLLIGQIVPPTVMVATHGIPAHEIAAGYHAVVILTGISLIGSVIPSIRSGYQELHYTYLWSGLSWLVVLAGLFFAVTRQPTVATFLLVMYGPITCVLLADAVLLCIQRPYLLRGRANMWRTGKMLAPQATNAVAGQFSYFLVSFLPTLIVAHLSGPRETAAFGSIMQLLILLSNGMTLFYQPLVPAIANAHAHHDQTWARKAYYRAALIVMAICAVGLLIDLFAGNRLLHLWLGPKIAIPPFLPIVLGVYFAMWVLNMLHFNILAATGGLNRVGKSYLVEGALSVVLGIVLTRHFGATGMAIGLALGTACVNFWFLPLQVRRHVVNLHWEKEKV